MIVSLRDGIEKALREHQQTSHPSSETREEFQMIAKYTKVKLKTLVDTATGLNWECSVFRAVLVPLHCIATSLLH